MPAVYAAIDLGGSHFTAAIGDAAGNMLAERRFETRSHEGPAIVLDRLAASIRELSREVGADPSALGLCVPGLVDIVQGITKFLPNMPTQWRDVAVRSSLETVLNIPVTLLNDARAATLGEREFGLGRSEGTFLLFTLGTGVGGGVVIDGRLRLGPLGAAGELGHIQVSSDGPLCSCGGSGCAETFASGPALVAEGVRVMANGNASRLRTLANGTLAAITPELMGTAARSGDAATRAIIERAGRYLGIAAAGVVGSIHPGLIVLAGGVSGLADLLIPPMRAAIAERVRMFPVNDLRIERSSLGDRAGVLGALALAIRGPAYLNRPSIP